MRGKVVATCGAVTVGVGALGLGIVQVTWWHLFGSRLRTMSCELDDHINNQVGYIESLMEGSYEEAG